MYMYIIDIFAHTKQHTWHNQSKESALRREKTLEVVEACLLFANLVSCHSSRSRLEKDEGREI